jgi:hypothetical protein
MSDRPNEVQRGYCTVAHRTRGDAYSLIAVGGRVVVWESKTHAEDFMFALAGSERSVIADARQERFKFRPKLPNKPTAAVIITDYDPYHAPSPIMSETHGFGWKHHVLHWLVFTDCGQFSTASDGSITNEETKSLVLLPPKPSEIGLTPDAL